MSEFLTPPKASAFLDEHGCGRTVGVLSRLRVEGNGPVFHKFGRSVRYKISDLQKWIAAKDSGPRRSTSESDRGEAA